MNLSKLTSGRHSIFNPDNFRNRVSVLMDGRYLIDIDNIIINMDGKITIIYKSTSNLDGDLNINKSSTNLFDGKTNVKDSSSNLLDGEVNVKDTNIINLDGNVDINDTTENGFDGKTNVKDSIITLLDGNIDVKNAIFNNLDGEVNVKNTAVITLDGKTNVKNTTSNLFDGIVNVKNAIFNNFDGIININDVNVDLFDGKVEVKDSSINLLDSKIYVKKSTINNLDGMLLSVRNYTVDGIDDFDGKVIVKDSNTNLFDGKLRISIPGIMYCDWLNGSDITGDGTNLNPYKTIDKASTGLTGGQEIRVAKSSDDISLTGTISFVDGSNTLQTAVNLSSFLSNGDFIYKTGEKDNLLEVISITSTTITLFCVYRGITEITTGEKLGYTSTGQIDDLITPAQIVMSSGTSTSSRLKISGGWSLLTQIQDGETYFQQLHSTFINKYGCGLQVLIKDFVEIENLTFLRYSIGLCVTDSNYNLFNLITCNNNNNGIRLQNSTFNILNSSICKCNIINGILLDIISDYNEINSPICNDNNSGIYLDNISGNEIITPQCNNNTQYGIYFNQSNNNSIFSPQCNNSQYGIYSTNSMSNIVNVYSGTGNSIDDIFVIPNIYYSEFPALKMQHYKAVRDNRCYYEHGITYRDDSESISGHCLRYAASSDIYYIKHTFSLGVLSGIEKTIAFFIKDNVDFDGNVKAALYFNEKNITGWADIPTTEEYIKHEFIALASNITENSVLDLQIKVRGTAGNVFVDDLGVA